MVADGACLEVSTHVCVSQPGRWRRISGHVWPPAGVKGNGSVYEMCK